MCGPIVYPPVITSIEPSQDCTIDTDESFFDRLFEFAVDAASTLTVIVNDAIAFVIEKAATFFSWLFDAAKTTVVEGINTIRLVAENSAGSTEKIIHAVITNTPVTSAPQITAKIPDQQAVSDVHGGSSVRTFGVTIDQPATITFSIDNQEKSKYYAVADATWECDFSAYSAGTYNVEVTAINSNGDDTFSWSWEIIEQPVITFITPSSGNVSNYNTNGKRLFSAGVNIPSILELYFNDRLIEKTSSETTVISHEFDLVPLGSHDVKIIAKKDDVQVERSWSWSVNEYGQNYQNILLVDQYRSSYNYNEEDYYAETNLILTSDKIQFSSGDWIYCFNLVIGSFARDSTGELPTKIHESEPEQYITGFRDVSFKVDKLSNDSKQVLLSSVDSYCFNHYPAPDGGYIQYVRNQKIEEIFEKLFSFVPKLGTVLGSIDIFNTICTPAETMYNIEEINFDIHHIFQQPTVYSSFSWFVRVEDGQTISFRINYLASDEPLFRNSIEKDIEITASTNPVVI